MSVASTGRTVNAAAVADALGAIAAQNAALADAHTPRSCVRAIATSLAPHVPLRRVELRAVAPAAVVELVAGEWRAVAPIPDPSARVLALGLAVTVAR